MRGRVRRRCARLLRALPMPVPFDARTLCERVAQQRGRPIQLVPMAGLTGVCGLWAATDHTDMIFYERDTTPPHQEHIILHELGHLLCDHHPEALSEVAQPLLPGLDPDMVRRVLARGGYSTAAEREAETFASMVRRQARTRADETVTDRLRTALGDERE